MCEQWKGVGVTWNELRAGTHVIVPVGAASARVNGTACVIAWGTILGPVVEDDPPALSDPSARWWLDVHMAPGICLRQAYRADEILGVPALSLAFT